MKYLAGTTYGCNLRTLQTIYKSLILATLDYGYEAYHTFGKSASSKLDRIQTKALRIYLGALQSSPNIAILAEVNELPLELHRLHRLHIYIHTNIDQTPTCMISYIHTYIHTHTHTYTYTYIYLQYIHTYVYIHA